MPGGQKKRKLPQGEEEKRTRKRVLVTQKTFRKGGNDGGTAGVGVWTKKTLISGGGKGKLDH